MKNILTISLLLLCGIYVPSRYNNNSYYRGQRLYYSSPVIGRSNIYGGQNYYSHGYIIQGRQNIFDGYNYYQVR